MNFADDHAIATRRTTDNGAAAGQCCSAVIEMAYAVCRSVAQPSARAVLAVSWLRKVAAVDLCVETP